MANYAIELHFPPADHRVISIRAHSQIPTHVLLSHQAQRDCSRREFALTFEAYPVRTVATSMRETKNRGSERMRGAVADALSKHRISGTDSDQFPWADRHGAKSSYDCPPHN